MNAIINWIQTNPVAVTGAIALLSVSVLAWAFHRTIVSLAVRAERDACAETAAAIRIQPERGEWSNGALHARDRIAAAIRARRAHLEPAHAYHLDRREQLDPETEARVGQAQALIAIGRLHREG